MHTPVSSAVPIDQAAGPLAMGSLATGPVAAGLHAQPGQASPAGSHAAHPVSFADLVYATVTGDPSPVQLQLAEAHFRDLNRLDQGAAALRQLRLVSEQHGRYPTLAFAPDTLAIPLMTAPHPHGTPLSAADEALHAAVADVHRLQLGAILDQYLPVIGQTIQTTYPGLTPGAGAAGSVEGANGAGIRDARGIGTAGFPRETDDTGIGDPIRLSRLPPRPVSRDDIRSRFQPYLAAQRTADRPMSEIVASWRGIKDTKLGGRWDKIDLLQHIRGTGTATLAFKKFIKGLMVSPIYELDASREEVSQWLVAAASSDRGKLREEAFRICEEGTAMCKDNALLTWNRLKMLMCKDDALAGRYAGRLDELCLIALHMLRWETLQTVAHAKILALHKDNQLRRDARMVQMNIDPIEIMLHYQVSLREELNLPLSVKEMACADRSPLQPEDMENAKHVIRRVETDSFHNYLMLDFTPFLAEVQRQIGPDKHAEVDAAIHNELAGFDERVTRRLQALQIPMEDEAAREDARRNMGLRIAREIRYSAWLPHANAALAAAGMAPMPALDIPEPAATARR